MNLNQLKYFVAVAKHGSFRRAAKELNISQPALSNSIKTLEEFLGAKLLERGPHQITRTPYGVVTEKFFSSALRSVDRATREIELMKRGSRGHVNIGAPTGLMSDLLPKIIGALRKKHPSYTFSVHFANFEQLLVRLREGTLDVLVTGYWNEAHLASDLTVESFAKASMSIYCRSQHPLVGKKEVSLQDLAEHEWILPDSPLTRSFLKSAFGGVGHFSTVNQPITSDFIPFIHAMMLSADLIGLISDYYVKDFVAEGSLVKLECASFADEVNVGLIYFEDRLRTPAMYAFLKMARDLGRASFKEEVDAHS
ncbi:LysR family transcriptional regulator [uncultured Parasphingorhabdus sp.]|uniref:LysR family transcriptional regulator n=1 Tax=uncultured Parasphingorhabdus sp. TaxID=2709694 RepID=UPI002AA65D92|nr:LysR family transcriptional regulator [uncultured Parasphingorhabdus sp.]